MLHLLDLLLVLELIEIVVRTADLVSVRSISWHTARSFLLALGIEDVLVNALFLVSHIFLKGINLVDTHKLLDELLFGDLLAVDQLFE